ncbi:MAG TPA: hypothetical protein DIV86_02505 [Alphaproteobacteria bacterium]|nr:hypothetical protein [Alphaproteobacteria bacterium]
MVRTVEIRKYSLDIQNYESVMGAIKASYDSLDEDAKSEIDDRLNDFMNQNFDEDIKSAVNEIMKQKGGIAELDLREDYLSEHSLLLEHIWFKHSEMDPYIAINKFNEIFDRKIKLGFVELEKRNDNDWASQFSKDATKIAFYVKGSRTQCLNIYDGKLKEPSELYDIKLKDPLVIDKSNIFQFLNKKLGEVWIDAGKRDIVFCGDIDLKGSSLRINFDGRRCVFEEDCHIHNMQYFSANGTGKSSLLFGENSRLEISDPALGGITAHNIFQQKNSEINIKAPTQNSINLFKITAWCTENTPAIIYLNGTVKFLGALDISAYGTNKQPIILIGENSKLTVNSFYSYSDKFYFAGDNIPEGCKKLYSTGSRFEKANEAIIQTTKRIFEENFLKNKQPVLSR